jgi:hypothetical protein
VNVLHWRTKEQICSVRQMFYFFTDMCYVLHSLQAQSRNFMDRRCIYGYSHSRTFLLLHIRDILFLVSAIRPNFIIECCRGFPQSRQITKCPSTYLPIHHFEVHTAVDTGGAIFCSIIKCDLVEAHQLFGGALWLHVQGGEEYLLPCR